MIKGTFHHCFALLTCLGLACGGQPASKTADASTARVAPATAVAPSVQRVAPIAKGERLLAPGFDGGSSWLNVSKPLSLEDLRGKIVVVDFWTSCCINCIHTLPILVALEKQFAGLPVVVVGVHSPKFDAEAGGDRLASIVDQFGIDHPVAIDANMKIWQAWKANSWPTVLVLDAEGKIAFRESGEPNQAQLFGTVASLLDEGAQNSQLNPAAIAAIRPAEHAQTPLRFPGKVIALPGGGQAISDTAHSRIVITSETGVVSAVIGSGLAGFTDGSLAEASFNKPQGLAVRGDQLFVADTENHALRKIDLKTKTVLTVAGTGTIGKGVLHGETSARTTALRSPWDLLAHGDRVYVALAGSHQIAVFDPAKGTLSVFAGNGREARIDGPADGAAFAQPSALASDGKSLFVADSETSSIRAIDFRTRVVRTVVGKDLFIFGDVDGDKETARLQHPLGVAFSMGALWVADTYNSKLKRVDPVTGETRSATALPKELLAEPGGLSVAADGALLLADTSHHRIVRIDSKRETGAALSFTGLTAPLSGVTLTRAQELIVPAENHLAVGGLALPTPKRRIQIAFSVPAGTGVNEDAPVHVRAGKNDGLVFPPKELRGKGKDFQKGFEIEAESVAGVRTAHLELVVDLVTCDIKTHRVCVPLTRQLDLTFVSDGKEGPIVLPLPEAK
jgi:DNA-binding beta-propeller fold protein YncE